MYKTTLKIDDMMCSMCEVHVNDLIRNTVPGAKKIKSSHKKGESSFISKEEPDEQMLKEEFSKLGYEISSMQTEAIEKKGLFG